MKQINQREKSEWKTKDISVLNGQPSTNDILNYSIRFIVA